MESAQRDELVPLKSSFSRSWRGWDRTEISTYLMQLETEIRRLLDHREKLRERNRHLESELEGARTENDELRAKLDQLSTEPIDPDTLDERMRRRLELAEQQAKEINNRAQVAADQRWSQAQASADRLLSSYEQMVTEAHRLRAEAETDYQTLMDRGRQDVEAMTREAEEQRRNTEEGTQRRQEQAEREHEAALAARLNEVNRQAEEREAASRAEAARHLDEANDQARRRIHNANQRVDAIRELRLGVAERIQSAQRILHRATANLEPTEAAPTPSPELPTGPGNGQPNPATRPAAE